MKNFKYWLIIIVRTVISCIVFYFLSSIFGMEVKADNFDRGQFAIDRRIQFTESGFVYFNPTITLPNSFKYGGYIVIPYVSSYDGNDNVTVRLGLSGPNFSVCSAIGGSLYCPIANETTLTYISVEWINLNGSPNFTIYQLCDYIAFKAPPTNQDVVDAIQSQQKQDQANADREHQDSKDTQDKIQEATDTIKDSNTDEATNSAGGFFNGFEDNQHGLSGIISSPLRLVQSFNNNTCQPLKFEIWGVSSELPCGSYIYDRNDIKPFIIAYNVIIGGLISYGAVRGIYKKVEDFKNPDNSKVEVLDL